MKRPVFETDESMSDDEPAWAAENGTAGGGGGGGGGEQFRDERLFETTDSNSDTAGTTDEEDEGAGVGDFEVVEGQDWSSHVQSDQVAGGKAGKLAAELQVRTTRPHIAVRHCAVHSEASLSWNLALEAIIEIAPPLLHGCFKNTMLPGCRECEYQRCGGGRWQSD